MSKPKRYDHKDCNWVGESMIEHPHGEWVKWEDYAALAAENERLRKAGDALQKWVLPELDDFEAWNAAKEGRDAK